MRIKDKEYVFEMKDQTFHCALDITMHYIGGKWKSIVLWYLRNGKKRFSELKRDIPEITEKMLSLQLRALEKDGLIGRKIYPEVPPKVEYFLTNEGETIVPAIVAMAKWGREKGEKDGKMVEKN